MSELQELKEKNLCVISLERYTLYRILERMCELEGSHLHNIERIVSYFEIKGDKDKKKVIIKRVCDFEIFITTIKEAEVFDNFSYLFYSIDPLKSILETNAKNKEFVQINFSRFKSVDIYFDKVYVRSIKIDPTETEQEEERARHGGWGYGHNFLETFSQVSEMENPILNKFHRLDEEKVCEFKINTKVLQYISLEETFQSGNTKFTIKTHKDGVEFLFIGEEGRNRIIFEKDKLIDFKYISTNEIECSEFKMAFFYTLKSLYQQLLKINLANVVEFELLKNLMIKYKIVTEDLDIEVFTYYMIDSFEDSKFSIRESFDCFKEEWGWKLKNYEEKGGGLLEDPKKAIILMETKIKLYEDRIAKWTNIIYELRNPEKSKVRWTKEKIEESGSADSIVYFHYVLSHYSLDEMKREYISGADEKIEKYTKHINKLREWIKNLEEFDKNLTMINIIKESGFKSKDIIDYNDRGNVSSLYLWEKDKIDEQYEILKEYKGKPMILFGGTGLGVCDEIIILDEIEKEKVIARGNPHFIDRELWALKIITYLKTFKEFATDEYHGGKEYMMINTLRVGFNLGQWKIKAII